MTDDIEFEPEKPSSSDGVGERAKREQKFIESPPKPNTVMLKLWKGGHLTFNPETHVPIFAIVALVVLLVSALVIAIVGIWIPANAIWMDKLFTAIGYAITAIVGAIVGAAVSDKKE